VKTLFTVHAGEFVVGDLIQKKFKGVNLWIPSKDDGIDFLVTDANNKQPVTLQVKYSRDYLETNDSEFKRQLKSTGWWTLNRKKIAESKADYWVFVLKGFEMKNADFIIIKPAALLQRLEKIHGAGKTIQSYLWVTRKHRCWESRDLKRHERLEIAEDQYSNPDRDFSEYLNNWKPVEVLIAE
jgi:hypothetical protein